MSGGFDVEQLLVDDLQILSTPLAGAEHKDVGVITHGCDLDAFANLCIQQMPVCRTH